MKPFVRQAHLKKLLTPLLALALIQAGSWVFYNDQAYANSNDYNPTSCANDGQTVAQTYGWTWGVSAYLNAGGTFSENVSIAALVPIEGVPLGGQGVANNGAAANLGVGFTSGGSAQVSDVNTCTQMYSQLGSQSTSSGYTASGTPTIGCANYFVTAPVGSGGQSGPQQCGNPPAVEDTAPSE